MILHISGVDQDGDACYWSDESWWRTQQMLWENRQLCKGVSGDGSD